MKKVFLFASMLLFFGGVSAQTPKCFTTGGVNVIGPLFNVEDTDPPLPDPVYLKVYFH